MSNQCSENELFLDHISVPQASENLGMAMVYTLVTSAKEWLVEKFSHDAQDEEPEENDLTKDDVCLFALPLTFSALW